MSHGYPSSEFESLDDLVEQIDKATTGWDTRWYRGVKNPEYGLLPKIFRDKDLQKREEYISIEFRRRARSQLIRLNSSFEWLCALQHYGLPTRLLDWTESLTIALYFSIRPLGLDIVAPTVWVLNPFELYELTKQNGGIIPVGAHEIVAANSDFAFDFDDLKKNASDFPVPVLPDFVFERLGAQNGTFTIHGKQTKPLEFIIPKHKRGSLLKFVASKKSLPSILKTLDYVIPSSDSIFPDIEGMKDYIV
jgi:hypothetical protein